MFEKIIDVRRKWIAKRQANIFDYHTDDFSSDEQAFLDRWLISYIELEAGRPPSRITEENILAMLKGQREIDTVGMETYIKWQSACQQPDNPNNTGGTFNDLQLSLKVMASQFTSLKARAAADASSLLAVMISSDLSRSVSDWTERTFEGAATIYDKAADYDYNMTHEGGALHRLFDEHTIGGLWKSTKDASPNDKLAEEVAGYVDAFLKDVSTVNGLPFFTLSPDTYDELANTLSQGLGIPKAWTADLLSFNMAELFGTSLGMISLAMNWNKASRKQFADHAVSLGIAAAFSANPLLGIVALVALAKALDGEKDKVAYTELLKGIGQGGIGTGLLLTACSVIGGPAWIGAIVGLILAIYARKMLGDTSAELMANWMSFVLKAAYNNFKSGVQTVEGVFPAIIRAG